MESFRKLFEESQKKINTNPGAIINGIVVSIKKDVIIVDAGLKSESSIPIEQFRNNLGKLNIKIGDKIDVVLDSMEDGYGETILSYEKAKRNELWLFLEKSYKDGSIITGIINEKVKGGFTVELNGISAFLPGSLVDIRPLKESIEGKELEFKVIKLDKKRNNIVVSRRAVIDNNERKLFLQNLHEGMEVNGIIKNITDYGAFIDLGGIDGLLHITDMSWKRIKHPNELLSIGDDITVKILKFDKESKRVSLGLKQLEEDPWILVANKYSEGNYLYGRVTNLTEYGCFVEIEEGIEGLVHISEIDWTNKNINPEKVVHVGDRVKVIILDIDKERRRISLGLKQCTPNPWKKFYENHKKGDLVQGKIKSITDFGIFVGFEGGIDGLIHLSDSIKNKIVHQYKKGDSITTILLQVDYEKQRIYLGLKPIQ